MYNFDEFIDRTGTGSSKWEQRAQVVKDASAVPLSVADMEFRCPPEVTAAVKRAADHGIYGYTFADDAYHDALADFMKRRHRCNIEREWVLVTNGVISALSLAIRALSEPGDGVVIQPPVYAPFLWSIKANDRKPLFNQLILRNGRYEINFDAFERLCAREETRLFILCSPHNPVGRVWTERELAELARICKKHSVAIVSDEIHADITFPGHSHASMLNIPEAFDNCVVCTAMSKSFNLAGLACSDIIIPNEQMRRKVVRQQHADHAYGLTYFARAASIAAHTECDAWLDALNAYLVQSFEEMQRFIEERLPMLACVPMEGTYLAWVDMRRLGLSDAGLKELMENEAKLSLTMGDWFGMGGAGFGRFNIALPRKTLMGSLARLEAAVNKLSEGRRSA